MKHRARLEKLEQVLAPETNELRIIVVSYDKAIRGEYSLEEYRAKFPERAAELEQKWKRGEFQPGGIHVSWLGEEK